MLRQAFLPCVLHSRAKRNFFGIFIVLIILTEISILEASSFHNFCQGVSHGSYFEYGCCNGTMLDLGVDLQANWKACAVPPSDSDETTIYDTMWRIYKCIIAASLGRKKSLSSYASKMTGGYPDSIKSMIMDVVGSTELNSKDLNTIRITYHNIERGVCIGNYKADDISVLTTCKDGKDIMRENEHFRGDCCNGEQLPIRLTYLRRQASEVSQECTRELVLKAGNLIGDDEDSDGFQTYQTKRYFNESDMQQLCLQTCIVKSDLEIEFDAFSPLPFDFESFSLSLVTIFPTKLQKEILKYVNNTRMRIEVDNFIHENTRPLMDAEFELHANVTAVRLLLNTCESHNLAVRTIEMSLMELCRVTPEPESTTTTEPTTISEPEPESEPDQSPEPESEPTSEPDQTSEPESEPTSEPDQTSEPESEQDQTSEPKSEPTPEPDQTPEPEPESEPDQTTEPQSAN